ncbi:type II toxin-antitoxin system RelE/ParE family toxin [Thalassolituus sp. LLYu03]|uniref:type II toxin-antitoxin system RelE/ParE family toxin n=1 Tax=Thalassolituus sp. LLYu03 TaxID=3421656 RepID=UPI003D2BA33F
MVSYKLSPQVEEDLYLIWLYGLNTWGMEAADQYISNIFHAFGQIANAPLQYPLVDEIRAGYRRCVTGKESIYFRVADEGVEVMAVIGRQEW